MINTCKNEKINGLDTLRFLSFFAVFLFHTIEGFEIGMYGVDFFFVLSSFLLTYLTLEEIDQTQQFSRLNFFMRRALRIFPVYYLVVLFSFILLPVLGKIINQTVSLPEKKWLYYFFLSNYDPKDSIFALKFLWSVAVEEQFYILFVLLAPLFKKHLFLTPSILAIAWVSSLFFPYQFNLHSYTATVSHLPNFILGMLGGICFYRNIQTKRFDLIICIGSLLICIFSANPIVFSLSISFFFISLIFMTINRQFFFKNFVLFKGTEKLGRLSYGLYIYSGFVITLVIKQLNLQNPYLNMLTALMLLLITAGVSYRYFEQFFLKMKRRFRKEPLHIH